VVASALDIEHAAPAQYVDAALIDTFATWVAGVHCRVLQRALLSQQVAWSFCALQAAA
jgi:hypothetical protein